MYVEQSWDVGERVGALVALSQRLDLRPGPGGSCATARRETESLFAPVVGDVFRGAWTGAMLVGLHPSSQIVAHRDPPIRGRRVHLPLAVNEGCWVFHGGIWQQLTVGRGYQMDPAEEHGAVNWGSTLRVHLVIDLAEER